MKTAGWSTRRFAGQVDRSECAVRNCWEQRTREGTNARKTGSGMTRKTTRREDRRIVRHLAEANLKSKHPFRALPLAPELRQVRLQWCQARSMWNVADWQKVVFTDESRFDLGTDALIVMRGTLTGQRYVDDILRPHIGPFLNGFLGAIFEQDNILPHTARVAQDFLRQFQTLPWPRHSPDLFSAEHCVIS
ncbi:transposable element Tc1 transposase [Trichonephila clavipes]|nr:transposable element Tc1 transposase [Trichonephila clavipes]